MVSTLVAQPLICLRRFGESELFGNTAMEPLFDEEIEHEIIQRLWTIEESPGINSFQMETLSRPRPNLEPHDPNGNTGSLHASIFGALFFFLWITKSMKPKRLILGATNKTIQQNAEYRYGADPQQYRNDNYQTFVWSEPKYIQQHSPDGIIGDFNRPEEWHRLREKHLFHEILFDINTAKFFANGLSVNDTLELIESVCNTLVPDGGIFFLPVMWGRDRKMLPIISIYGWKKFRPPVFAELIKSERKCLYSKEIWNPDFERQVRAVWINGDNVLSAYLPIQESDIWHDDLHKLWGGRFDSRLITDRSYPFVRRRSSKIISPEAGYYEITRYRNNEQILDDLDQKGIQVLDMFPMERLRRPLFDRYGLLFRNKERVRDYLRARQRLMGYRTPGVRRHLVFRDSDPKKYGLS